MEYETSDQYMAAFCLAAGAKLLRTVPGTRVVFVLSDPGGATTRAADEYRHGEALVPARDYAEAIRDCKWALQEAQDQDRENRRARQEAAAQGRVAAAKARAYRVGGAR